ncbi:MAG: hypothetical protein R2911_02995 [Caldilineaceae bacterium]
MISKASSGFGRRLLFTPDDPIVRLPQGYTVVNMDVPLFSLTARHAAIDLVEPKSATTDDFSQLYTDAFDAMIAKLRKEYAFTDYKHIDWDARVAEFRPRFAQAAAQNDKRLYRQALHDFAVSIPDGHVSGPFLVDEFRAATGGIGLAYPAKLTMAAPLSISCWRMARPLVTSTGLKSGPSTTRRSAPPLAKCSPGRPLQHRARHALAAVALSGAFARLGPSGRSPATPASLRTHPAARGADRRV